MAQPRPYPRNDGTGTSGDGVPASPSFPALEIQVLDYWRADSTFAASIDQRDRRRPGSAGNRPDRYAGPSRHRRRVAAGVDDLWPVGARPGFLWQGTWQR